MTIYNIKILEYLFKNLSIYASYPKPYLMDEKKLFLLF